VERHAPLYKDLQKTLARHGLRYNNSMELDALWEWFVKEFSRPKPELIFSLKEKLPRMEFPEGSFLHFLAGNNAHWQNLAAALMIGFDLWELDGEGRTPLLAVADDWSQN